MSVTIHHGTSFVVADDVGDIAPDGDSGYFHLDTRFLSRHELRLDGRRPIPLQTSVPHADEAWHALTNPALDGAPRTTLGISVHRLVGGGLRAVAPHRRRGALRSAPRAARALARRRGGRAVARRRPAAAPPRLPRARRRDRRAAPRAREGPAAPRRRSPGPRARVRPGLPRRRRAARQGGRERGRGRRRRRLRHRRGHPLVHGPLRARQPHRVVRDDAARSGAGARHARGARAAAGEEGRPRLGGGARQDPARVPARPAHPSVRFRDGRIASPPIALVEVQGYAYDARRRTAELARHLEKGEVAERLEEEAAALRRAIAERFWLADRAFFAEALDGAKRPVDSLTSNPGHLLWSGAVDAEKARAVARVVAGDELFSGFGVRTMGSAEGGYNPVSYHDGSVWPHDNALVLAGLVRYGLVDEASRVAGGLLAALGHFADAAPPELFCGYGADRFGAPVGYPTACRPQAWASAAVVLVARTLLGLEVDALRRRLAVAPLAVPGLTRLALIGVPAGGARLSVEMRVEGGRAAAEVKGLPRGWRRVDPAEARDVVAAQ